MNEKTLKYFRNKVKEALSSKKISEFLGWREVEGLPGKTRIFVAKTPEEAELLTFNSFCRENPIRLLAGKTNYMPENGKLGVMLKGCDSRSMLANTSENKLDKSNLWIVGVKCPGTVDVDRLRASLDADIKTIEEKGEKLIVTKLDGKKEEFAKSDFQDTRCLKCKYPETLEAAELLPDDFKKAPIDDPEKFAESYLEKPFKERADFILSHLSRCTMCFACRDACPGCYCNDNCIMDYPKLPEPYLGKIPTLKGILTYHFIHYFHLSDRCTNCGECARACPEGIPLNLITEQLAYMQKSAFGFEAGISDQAKSPLDLYKVEEVLGR